MMGERRTWDSVSVGDLLPTGNPSREPRHLGHAQRTLHIGQPVVVAQINHVIGERALGLPHTVIAVDAVVAEPAHDGCLLGVRCERQKAARTQEGPECLKDVNH